MDKVTLVEDSEIDWDGGMSCMTLPKGEYPLIGVWDGFCHIEVDGIGDVAMPPSLFQEKELVE